MHRRSSRRTPARQPQPQHSPFTGWRARLALGCCAVVLAAGLAGAAWRAPVGTGGVLLVLAAVTAHAMRSERRRLERLAHARRGESICGFARAFDLREVDPLVVRVVYSHVQGQLSRRHPPLPLRATDDLAHDLGLDLEDLEMAGTVHALAQATGRSIDHTEANPWYGRVKTMADLVLFFDRQPEWGLTPSAGAPPH